MVADILGPVFPKVGAIAVKTTIVKVADVLFAIGEAVRAQSVHLVGLVGAFISGSIWPYVTEFQDHLIIMNSQVNPSAVLTSPSPLLRPLCTRLHRMSLQSTSTCQIHVSTHFAIGLGNCLLRHR